MRPSIHIKNGNLILKDAVLKNSSLLIDGSKISSVGKPRPDAKGAIIIDAEGCFVSAGFIDCHIHGSPGKIFRNEARSGTTSFVVAESAAPLAKIYEDIESINKFVKTDPLGPNVLGVHIEGPYISLKKRGAQNPRYIKRPDAGEVPEIIKRCGSLLKIMTIAPELEGAIPLIKLLKRNGVIASIGHSDATYKGALEGISAGARHATHLFNAMSGVNKSTRKTTSGVVTAVLSDNRVTTEVILDLIHVHKSLFRLLLKSKPLDDIILITDSVRNTIKSGVYRLKDGTIAGSALTMIKAVENAVKAGGLSLVNAVRLATLNPARFLGVDSRKGALEAGKDADIVIFDRKFKVKVVIIRGKIADSG